MSAIDTYIESNKDRLLNSLLDQMEAFKARIRAKVEHPFQVVKQQFGHVKTESSATASAITCAPPTHGSRRGQPPFDLDLGSAA